MALKKTTKNQKQNKLAPHFVAHSTWQWRIRHQDRPQEVLMHKHSVGEITTQALPMLLVTLTRKPCLVVRGSAFQNTLGNHLFSRIKPNCDLKLEASSPKIFTWPSIYYSTNKTLQHISLVAEGSVPKMCDGKHSFHDLNPMTLTLPTESWTWNIL